MIQSILIGVGVGAAVALVISLLVRWSRRTSPLAAVPLMVMFGVGLGGVGGLVIPMTGLPDLFGGGHPGPSQIRNDLEATGNIRVITDDTEFQRILADARAPVLTVFTREHDPASRRLHEPLQRFAQERKGGTVVVEIDVDRGRAVAMRFSVENLPMLIVHIDGRRVASGQGYHNLEGLAALVDGTDDGRTASRAFAASGRAQRGQRE
jgi:Thioredoxin